MFWTNIYTLSPHIEALLNKADITLHELMDQEEIVPECKSNNKKLIEYLTKPEVLEELVTLTVKEPSNEVDEKWRYKYPNVACELLTCNVPKLNETLAGSEALLSTLYSFIDTDNPLNPLLASFFSKIIGVLLIRKGDQNWYSYQFMCLHVLEFLKSRQQCVGRLLQHLETSAIMDLVLKLVTKVEGNDMRQNILNWLDNQQFVQQLIKLLSPTADPIRHANAAQLLSDIVQAARDYRLSTRERVDPDPILITLESDETITLILDTILTEDPVESSIVGGIQVLITLLGYEGCSIFMEREMKGYSSIDGPIDVETRSKKQNAILPYLEKLHKILLNPPPKPAVQTTAGILEIPFGNTRLHVAKLFTSLLATYNFQVFQPMEKLGTFQTLLDLFFKYSCNNFLHTQVEQCLRLLIVGYWDEISQSVYTHIFAHCKLIERILEAWDKNENKQNKANGVRQGYMGHLINIVNYIAKNCEESEDFAQSLKENLSEDWMQKWETFVNTQLAEINKTHESQLGEGTQSYIPSSEDGAEEYQSYSQDNFIQQAYTNYQGQQMTSPFIEHYGLHDDEFNDNNDSLQPSNSVDQLTTMPFTLSEEDLVKQEESFNKICQQKQKAGLEDGGIEWGDEGELTFQTVIDKRDWPFKQQQHDSISSDEDEETKDLHMEVDSTDPWDSAEPLPGNAILPEVNPWDSVTSPTEESSGWANFENFDSTLTIAEPQSVSANVKNLADTTAQEVPDTMPVKSDVKQSLEELEKPIIPAANEPDETIEIAAVNSGHITDSNDITTAETPPIDSGENLTLNKKKLVDSENKPPALTTL